MRKRIARNLPATVIITVLAIAIIGGTVKMARGNPSDLDIAVIVVFAAALVIFNLFRSD